VGSIRKQKIYIPVKDHPGVNFLGLLIGPRGATQKQMQEVSGAKILIRGRGAQKDGMLATHPDDDDELHVSIEGTDEAIERATQEVQQILFNPEQAMQLKNSQLQSLAEMNGTTIPPPVTTISDSSESDYQIELRIPNNMVGLVIGKGGENIHRMQAQTGATIQIAKESEMKPGDTVRSVWLKGSPSAVAEMKIKVDEIINAKINPGGTQSQSQTQTTTIAPKTMIFQNPEFAYVIKLPIPNDKVGIIIGKGGMTVKSIQERTRASILIPTGPDEDNAQVRTITVGADSQAQAETCQMEIYNVLQASQHQQAHQASVMASAMHIQVPDDKVGLIIGKGGMTIKDMQSRLRVKIQIPQSADPGTMPPVRTLTVIGPPESQHLARYELELVVSGQGHTIGAANPYAQQQQQQQASYGGGGAWGKSIHHIYIYIYIYIYNIKKK